MSIFVIFFLQSFFRTFAKILTFGVASASLSTAKLSAEARGVPKIGFMGLRIPTH